MIRRNCSTAPSRGAVAFRRWRGRAKLTQRQVAAELGIWPGSISELESGKRVPTLVIAVKIEQLASVKPSAWLET